MQRGLGGVVCESSICRVFIPWHGSDTGVCVCTLSHRGVLNNLPTCLPVLREWGAFHHLAPLWQCTRIFFLFLCFCVLFVLFGLIAAGWLHVGGASTQRDTGHCEACTLTGEGPQEGIHAIVTVVYKTS